MYVLDTDHLGILTRRRGIEFDTFVKRVTNIGETNIYVTIVSFHEIVTGRTKYVKQSQDPQKIVTGYFRLETILRDFASAQVLSFSTVASEIFEDIKRQKLRLATMDLRIAPIAISQQMLVVTRNTLDYERIPGLTVEDWTS